MTRKHYARSGVTVWSGDCVDVMRGMDAESIDAVVCDPPYNLGFMGRKWDTHDGPPAFQEWCRVWAGEALRVLKPGGFLLAFGGTRTYHRLTSGIEDAGLEIRDSITWLYGSGFPKSRDVSKAIDKAAGAERGPATLHDYAGREGWTSAKGGVREEGVYELGIGAHHLKRQVTTPATDAARQWSGWGTALKPASESIVVARKSLTGTVAATVLRYGTGALNIAACRVDGNTSRIRKNGHSEGYRHNDEAWEPKAGRWPTNVVLSHAGYVGADGTEVDLCAGGCVAGCAVAELDEQSGVSASNRTGTVVVPGRRDPAGHLSGHRGGVQLANGYGDAGGASRYFPTFRYQAKAPRKERPRVNGITHPTVKPLALMRWLVRLVTQPGGTVLDPFAGSGTTGEACVLEGFTCHLIESHEPYLPLIVQRLKPYEDVAALARARGRAAPPKPRKVAETPEDALFDLEDAS